MPAPFCTSLSLLIHLHSVHIPAHYMNLNPNNENYGMGISCSQSSGDSIHLGTYKNSYYKQTNYLTLDSEIKSSESWRIGILTGITTGYKYPIIGGGSIQYSIPGTRINLGVVIVPFVYKVSAAAIHGTISVELFGE